MLANGTLLQERYRIKRLLAQGGMGAFYEAEAVHLGNAQVAVKQTFFSEQQRTMREQFEREAATMARLRHPALPRVSDHFVEGGEQFLVMEFVPGADLLTLLQRRGRPFDRRLVMTWAETLLDALDYIHTRYPPVIHRDIKPQFRSALRYQDAPDARSLIYSQSLYPSVFTLSLARTPASAH
ncbi:MAG TPA: protein kinase [Blastocatellia bacterium]|nr:protein kinase [Blastocatellia bacterium]